MFTKRSWESFYSGLIMVGLVFMVCAPSGARF